jgi:hypothetical protein
MNERNHIPNRVLVQRRGEKGWGRDRLAAEFERVAEGLGLVTPSRAAMAKAIYRHETGRNTVGDDMYRRLYSTVYHSTPHELFGDLNPHQPAAAALRLSSHKFVPVYVGINRADQLKHQLSGESRTWEWGNGWAARVRHPHGPCTVYGFPWGAVTYHIEEDVPCSTVAAVAVWRARTHDRDQKWVADHVRSILKAGDAIPHYVLSAFWLHDSAWSAADLGTAMRLLCTPRVLLDHGSDRPSIAHAELVEKVMIQDGYDDNRIESFGVTGVSLGFASRAGVSYFPLAARRALDPASFVAYEAVVQGLWIYCHDVRVQIESGQDPVVSPEFGWRWLRGVRSRLECARPNETSQHAAMREAILKTSELGKHLTATLDVVRDCTVNSEG